MSDFETETPEESKKSVERGNNKWKDTAECFLQARDLPDEFAEHVEDILQGWEDEYLENEGYYLNNNGQYWVKE